MPKPKTNEFLGTDFDDVLIGTSANELFRGYSGNDEIYGGGGSDSIFGGDGDDYLDGGDGNDRVVGDGGNNIVHGGAGDDEVVGSGLVFGDAGNDRVMGGEGDDQLFGGEGNDVLIGDFGADSFTGGSGADVFLYRFGIDSTTRTDTAWAGDGIPNLPTGVDTIQDFQAGLDIIDLRQLDANLETPIQQVKQKGGPTTIGSDAFVVVASTDGATPGHLTATYDSIANLTTVNGYMDSQFGADFTLHIVGEINLMTDFLL
jgi:Ca2+-binding RTX toxin-like protein